MLIHQIKIVDLEKSDVDWEKSKPEDGKFVFNGPKVYYNRAAFRNTENMPPHVVKWCTTMGDGWEIKRWQDMWGYDFVVAGRDPYYPELVDVDSEGHYIKGDAVLMLIPTASYVEKRKHDMERANRSADVEKQKFQNMVSEHGASVDEEMLGDIFGE